MKLLISIFVLLSGSLSYGDIPFPVHLMCRGNGFSLDADVLTNVIKSNRLTNINVQLGSKRASIPQMDGRLDQGHIWMYVYNFAGVEFGIEYPFAQKLNAPLRAYFIVALNNTKPFDIACKVTGSPSP